MYLCELVRNSAYDGTEESERIFRLFLNTLHFIEKYEKAETIKKEETTDTNIDKKEKKGSFTLPVLKSIFEIRLMSELGFTPEFNSQTGFAKAVNYICQADLKKLWCFSVSKSLASELSHYAENYTLKCMERGFSSLDFYNGVK
jgi:hypothetical protein